MEVQQTNHPAPEVLRALVAKQLDAAAAEAAMAHLEGCSACREAAATASGDSFLMRLRAGRSSGSTVSPAQASSDTQGSKVATRSQPNVPPDVLPELRDHPQYEVVRELGRGGMGVVYLARNKLMDRQEILKVVSKQLLDSPGAGERFQREIRAAAKLSHANIVSAHSAFHAGDLLVFAMEFVDGETLAQLVKGRGGLPVVQACYYAQQVAQGLQHAFERGLIHRDIKPQNLIMARQGKKHTIKILDFGLAKATREGGPNDTGMTGTGAMLGTPDYIAPEQTLDAAKADIRADIYSLGCTLYFMLSGAPPFQGNSMFEVLQAHLSKEAVPLNQVRTDVPAELAAVVAKMMAKDAAQRYQKPSEVVQALMPFVQGGVKAGAGGGSVVNAPPAAAPAAGPPTGGTLVEGSHTIAKALKGSDREPERPEAVRPPRKRPAPLVLGAAGLAGVLVLVGGLILLTRDSKPESAGDSGKGRPTVQQVPANLRTTVNFVDYEVIRSRFNGRVWELTLKATAKRTRRLNLFGLEVTTDDGEKYRLPPGKVMVPTVLPEGDPIRIKITMSNLPPNLTKLARVLLVEPPIGDSPKAAAALQEKIVFLDVPIEPDPQGADAPEPAPTHEGNTKNSEAAGTSGKKKRK